MKKIILTGVLSALFFSGVGLIEACATTPKKKSNLEKRLKQQSKKKKKKGDTGCPKIDC
jgi:hypothetical protein